MRRFRVARHEQCVLIVSVIEGFVLHRNEPFHVFDIIRGNFIGYFLEGFSADPLEVHTPGRDDPSGSS
jgi:hypothetical protein